MARLGTASCWHYGYKGDDMSGDSGNSYDEYATAYGSPTTYLDVSNIPRHEVLNFEGTPTQFSDETGLRGILTRSGIKDVSSFNPIVKPGEKITADTPIQQVDEEGVLLFSDGEGVTRRNTGVPAIAGTVGDQAYMREIKSRGGVFGPILGDFVEAAKDPYFHKFLAAAAAIGTGGLALNAAYGVGGLGAAGATAIPVELGGTIAGTELGAGAGGAGGLGSFVGPSGAGEFIAADAAANAAGQGAFNLASSLGMPLDQAVTSGLITGGGALTDAGALALLGGGAGTATAGAGGLGGITGSQALKAARLALPAIGAVTRGGGAGGGAGGGGNYGSYGTGGGGALPGSLASTSLPGSSVAMLDPFKDYNKFEQIRAVQDDQDMRSIPISEPLYAASGGDVTSLAQIQERLSQLDPRLNSVLQNKLKANYYTYGSDSSGGLPTQLMNSQLGSKPSPGYPAQAASNARTPLYDTYGFKPASLNTQERAPETVYAKDGGHIPEFITGATGHYVKGRGDGQSDSIPAMLADGEYVFDAETVAQLGNGSSDAGAKILDRMRENIRAHKRSAPVDKIPPKSKSPLEYMAESKRK